MDFRFDILYVLDKKIPKISKSKKKKLNFLMRNRILIPAHEKKSRNFDFFFHPCIDAWTSANPNFASNFSTWKKILKMPILIKIQVAATWLLRWLIFKNHRVIKNEINFFPDPQKAYIFCEGKFDSKIMSDGTNSEIFLSSS